MSQLKKCLLFLGALLLVPQVAYAAVRSIADTEYNAGITPMSASADDGSHTSTFDISADDPCPADAVYMTKPTQTATYDSGDISACSSFCTGKGFTSSAMSIDVCKSGTQYQCKCNSTIACGSSVIEFSSSTATTKSNCATALTFKSGETPNVTIERCSDNNSSKFNCLYATTCNSSVTGTSEKLSGSTAAALKTAVFTSRKNHTVTNNNAGTIVQNCSTGKENYLYYQCNSDYNLNAPATCGNNLQLFSCTLNGGTKYKCSAPMCTTGSSGTRNQTLNASSVSYTNGTITDGACYDWDDTTLAITKRNILVCKDTYKWTIATCKNFNGSFNVASDQTPYMCQWNGAIRDTTNTALTVLNPDSFLYPYCLPECRAGQTTSDVGCLNGEVLNKCVRMVNENVNDNVVLEACSCPLDADGNNIYQETCPAGKVLGGRSCTDANGVLRYEYCLPSCPSGKTVAGSNKECLENLQTVTSSARVAAISNLMYTPLPTALFAAPASTRAATTITGTCYAVDTGTGGTSGCTRSGNYLWVNGGGPHDDKDAYVTRCLLNTDRTKCTYPDGTSCSVSLNGSQISINNSAGDSYGTCHMTAYTAATCSATDTVCCSSLDVDTFSCSAKGDFTLLSGGACSYEKPAAGSSGVTCSSSGTSDDSADDPNTRYVNNGKCCHKVNGVYTDCEAEPFVIVDATANTCRIDRSYYCTNGYLTKDQYCGETTSFCCQYNSSGAIINSSCLEEGNFVTNTATGICWAGTNADISGEYCATADKKKDIYCENGTTTQCCTFKGLSTVSTDVNCSSKFVLLSETKDGVSTGACSKVGASGADSQLCYSTAGDAKANYICSCPADYKADCAAGETALATCTYDGGTKKQCATACPADANRVKTSLEECKVIDSDVSADLQGTACYDNAGNQKISCSCPKNYKSCPDGGVGTPCTYEGAANKKYKSCIGEGGTVACTAGRKTYDSSASCQTANGTSTSATECYVDGALKYMCSCPGDWDGICTAGTQGGGDTCSVYDDTTRYQKCGRVCRLATASQPNVAEATGCPDIDTNKAVAEQCIAADASLMYECHCPTGYKTVAEYVATLPAEERDKNWSGVGTACTYDGGDAKYGSFNESCPNRPLFYTADSCSFEGIKGINVKSCQLNGESSEENRRYYCDCPTSYHTDTECAATTNNEGSGLMCQLEGSTAATTKYQYCRIKCGATNSAGNDNGVYLEDDIADNRSCVWELGQGATYAECSKNHTIMNKCYCGADYDSRLECLAEDNLAPLVDDAHPACIVSGKTYYRDCMPRACDESKLISLTTEGCTRSLGTAATWIKCTKNDNTEAYECGCDKSLYKEICTYPKVEPTTGNYCYDREFNTSNPNPKKQYRPGSCQLGAIEKCTNGNVSGYTVFVTRTESECVSKIGDGAEARLCEDPVDPDIRMYNCYYKTGEYKWTEDNCPVRHVLGGGSIVINGKRYYKECNCHSAYTNHRYNCAGILSGGACEQEVNAANNDGSIPASITTLKFYPYCSCPEDYNQVCDGEKNVGVGEACNGKYKACECKKEELPPNWADNYYGCPNEQKPTGVTKPNGCGGKYYQCEKSNCTWQHTEQCTGDFQIGVDPCQDNLGNVSAYKSCKCPIGWKKCSGEQVGVGKPCALKGDNYYETCTVQDTCTKGEYLTCNGSLQVGINPCTKNDKTYFESCSCASGYNKACDGDGETGVGSYCELNGVKYYTACTTPAMTCTSAHKDGCADNQEKYDPCLTAEGTIKYKCRCPANYVTCSATSPAEGATSCQDAERGTVYNACAGVATCTEDEESIYKSCNKQQVGIGNSCTSSDGTTKYAECQDTKDCKANGYKYTCSGYAEDGLGTDMCIDDKGNKLYKECKCPTNYLECSSKNVKGTPCQPLQADGTYGKTVYSKCECSSIYSESCTGNGQVPGSETDSCQSLDDEGEVVTKYKSCSCSSEFNKTCGDTGAAPTEDSEICTEVKYVGNQMVKRQLYRSCGCGTDYKYKCDGSDTGDDANNATKYTLSGACTTSKDGESLTLYKNCACSSTYNTSCTSNIQPGADYCMSINADGSRTTKYVAGSCPEPECEPTDCSLYTVPGGSIEASCGHEYNYGDSCTVGCGDYKTRYICKYSKSDVELYKYTTASCKALNSKYEAKGASKTFTWANGQTETRYTECDCSDDYDKTAASCQSLGSTSSSIPTTDGNLLCSSRNVPAEGEAFEFTPAVCGSTISLDTSDTCKSKSDNVVRGKNCMCSGLGYSDSACSGRVATVCKKSSATNWQTIVCN